MFPSVGTPLASSELVVDVSVVVAELRGSLIISWPRIGQFSLEDLFKDGLSLLIVKFGLGSTLILREDIAACLGQSSYILVLSRPRHHSFFFITKIPKDWKRFDLDCP